MRERNRRRARPSAVVGVDDTDHFGESNRRVILSRNSQEPQILVYTEVIISCFFVYSFVLCYLVYYVIFVVKLMYKSNNYVLYSTLYENYILVSFFTETIPNVPTIRKI